MTLILIKKFLPTLIVLLGLWGCTSPKQEGLLVYVTGDVMLDRGVRQAIKRKGISHLFANTADSFKTADAVVVNLECPLTSVVAPQKKPFTFRGDPSWADSLKLVGVTHACLANNHSFDQGAAGLQETVGRLKRSGIAPIGGGTGWEERYTPALICKGGDSLALFSAFFLSTGPWENKGEEMGICQSNATKLGTTISQYKQKHPHTKAIAILHWGTEYEERANQMQRQQADTLASYGADMVIGHHPHVKQGTDTLQGKLVYYSLGNFIFDNSFPKTRFGTLLKINCKNGQLNADTLPIEIERCVPKPVF